jgi:hypothetical protein
MQQPVKGSQISPELHPPPQVVSMMHMPQVPEAPSVSQT